MIFVGAAPDDDAAVKQEAQDWLNKLVAQCATNFSVKSKSSTCKENLQVPQFTAEDIELIQEALKAQADSWAAHCREDKYKPLDMLVSKCDAMLEGAEA